MRSHFVLPHLYSTEYSTESSTEYSTVQYSTDEGVPGVIVTQQPVTPHLYSTEYSTVQYSTEYSTVQYSIVQCSTDEGD